MLSVDVKIFPEYFLVVSPWVSCSGPLWNVTRRKQIWRRVAGPQINPHITVLGLPDLPETTFDLPVPAQPQKLDIDDNKNANQIEQTQPLRYLKEIILLWVWSGLP